MINVLNEFKNIPVEKIYYLLKKLEKINNTALILKNMGLVIRVDYKGELKSEEF